MNTTRGKAIADWFLEISALLMVFPALDCVLHPAGGPSWLPWTGLILGILFFLVGVYLMPSKEAK